MTQTSQQIAQAINSLLERNDYTAETRVAEMFLGESIFVARLCRPIVIEGQWEDTDKTVDIFDLMDEHGENR